MGIIRELAGKEYRLGYDEASGYEPKHLEEGRRLPDDMYEIVPCKYGEIYDYGSGKLAWMCAATRLARRLIREIPWMEVQVDSADAVIFLLPQDKFVDVAKMAGARTKRQLTEEQKEKLLEAGKPYWPSKGHSIGTGR